MFGIKELERAFRDLEIDYNGVLKNEDKIFEDLELDSLMIVTLICADKEMAYLITMDS
jgi:acyl carrier protein